MTEEPQLPPWLADAAAGLASGDLDAWMSLYAGDAVHEFPFAAPGAVRRLDGAGAIRAYMAKVGGAVRFGRLDDLTVREAGDEVIIDAEGHHVDAVTGEPFDVRYLWIITRREGKVTHLRDYMGPRRPSGARA